MLIDIKSVSRSREAFIEIDTEIGADVLSVSFQEYRLAGPVTFRGRLQADGDDVLGLTGRLTGSFDGICARCLEPVHQSLDVAVDEIYRPTTAGEGETESESYRYEGHMVDLLPAIRDNLVLSLPPRLFCRQECRGLCPVCGTNLNEKDCGCHASEQESLSPFDQLKQLL